jgi:hypothetical protein
VRPFPATRRMELRHDNQGAGACERSIQNSRRPTDLVVAPTFTPERLYPLTRNFICDYGRAPSPDAGPEGLAPMASVKRHPSERSALGVTGSAVSGTSRVGRKQPPVRCSELQVLHRCVTATGLQRTTTRVPSGWEQRRPTACHASVLHRGIDIRKVDEWTEAMRHSTLAPKGTWIETGIRYSGVESEDAVSP